MTKFAAKRYMDDILLLMQKEGWDRQRFYEDFKRSECYARPLNLGVYGLETVVDGELTVQLGGAFRKLPDGRLAPFDAATQRSVVANGHVDDLLVVRLAAEVVPVHEVVIRAPVPVEDLDNRAQLGERVGMGLHE